VHEDMSELINELKPMRWKIFQVLPIKGENFGENSKRDVTKFLIPNEKFNEYITRNKMKIIDKSIIKEESNDIMQSSYYVIDEYGCFLDTSCGSKKPTKSILDVGVELALKELLSSNGGGFNQHAFELRDGMYDTQWSKEGSCGNGTATVDLEDIMKPKNQISTNNSNITVKHKNPVNTIYMYFNKILNFFDFPSNNNMNNNEPFSIAIEGLDGVGKTSIAEHLALKLKNAVYMKTPPDIIKPYRNWFDNNGNIFIREGYYMLGNFLASTNIENLLKLNKSVIIDRYYASTIAYRNGKNINR
jgi:hypothetical protein